MDELKFREWLIEHSPDEKMIWEPEYWKAYVFGTIKFCQCTQMNFTGKIRILTI